MLQPIHDMFQDSVDENMLVGLRESDDAAVYEVADGMSVIQTVDFFPPIVDDPWTYGAISAANAMSDVYAMGGDVKFGLNIVCLLYTSPSPRDGLLSRMPSSA